MSSLVGVASQEVYFCSSERTFPTSFASNFLTIAVIASLFFMVRISCFHGLSVKELEEAVRGRRVGKHWSRFCGILVCLSEPPSSQPVSRRNSLAEGHLQRIECHLASH